MCFHVLPLSTGAFKISSVGARDSSGRCFRFGAWPRTVYRAQGTYEFHKLNPYEGRRIVDDMRVPSDVHIILTRKDYEPLAEQRCFLRLNDILDHVGGIYKPIMDFIRYLSVSN